MNRRKFLRAAGLSIGMAGGTTYLLSDKRNYIRADTKADNRNALSFQPGERDILSLASLAPSGHNTQPWIVKYLEPYHWVIGNDRTRWLPAVDPTQRETILSIGAFLQNLEYAANDLGYDCEFSLLAANNQAEDIMEVILRKALHQPHFDIKKIMLRRTVRSGFQTEVIKTEDLDFLMSGEPAGVYHFFPTHSREYQWLNEQTIEANRRQAYRDDAQSELGDWMRFSRKDAQRYNDGLTPASMEIAGISGWILRNFYTKDNVMTKKFRDQGIDQVKLQVNRSGGWLLLTSPDNSTAGLLETGKRLQRILLKIRERNIAIHPMTQILEEPPYSNNLNSSVGVAEPVQFVLRTGYLKQYPDPVSLRRPLKSFVGAF